jgi:hypothetical protein
MEEKQDEVQLTKLETVFTVGIIGCLLFATWELAHLTADQWFRAWVHQSAFVRRRVIYYGIAFLMGGAAVLFTTVFAFRLGRFGRTVNRAFLWYGVLLLISTIGIFVFDCLPEVFAGFIGAAVFIGAIYVLQKKFYTRERIIRLRLEKGRCFSCGAQLHPTSMFCGTCGIPVGRKCSSCGSLLRLKDRFCWNCRRDSEQEHPPADELLR